MVVVVTSFMRFELVDSCVTLLTEFTWWFDQLLRGKYGREGKKYRRMFAGVHERFRFARLGAALFAVRLISDESAEE